MEALTGLRFLAALHVVFYHYYSSPQVGDQAVRERPQFDLGSDDAEIGGMKVSPICIKLSLDELIILEHIGGRQKASYRDVIRAQTILLLAEGKTISAVARCVGRQRRIVRKWAVRFEKERIPGLADAPRSGRPARFSPLRRLRPV